MLFILFLIKYLKKYYLWSMNWNDIVGQKVLISSLKDAIENDRVAHAQLFVGKDGYGGLPLALAYAQEIFSRENSHSASKVETLNHLDLHFSFPVYSEKNDSKSKRFFQNWRKMILENPYASFQDFGELLEAKNKQLIISASEVEEWGNIFNLKSYEGGTKILIIWRADRINESAANKFLKFLEEPPQRTLIFLLADSIENMLQTILSRCQIVEIPRINDDDIFQFLTEKLSLPEDKAMKIVHQVQGDYNIALKIAKEGDVDEEFEDLFILWVRNAFQAKKKPEVLKEIIFWARNIALWDREKQKNFLSYCLETFRLALLQNYGVEEVVYRKLIKNNFNWERFSRYIHGVNIETILEEISEANIHLYRNANSKIVWTDLGIKLIRNLHKSY